MHINTKSPQTSPPKKNLFSVTFITTSSHRGSIQLKCWCKSTLTEEDGQGVRFSMHHCRTHPFLGADSSFPSSCHLCPPLPHSAFLLPATHPVPQPHLIQMVSSHRPACRRPLQHSHQQPRKDFLNCHA